MYVHTYMYYTEWQYCAEYVIHGRSIYLTVVCTNLEGKSFIFLGGASRARCWKTHPSRVVRDRAKPSTVARRVVSGVSEETSFWVYEVLH